MVFLIPEIREGYRVIFPVVKGYEKVLCVYKPAQLLSYHLEEIRQVSGCVDGIGNPVEELLHAAVSLPLCYIQGTQQNSYPSAILENVGVALGEKEGLHAAPFRHYVDLYLSGAEVHEVPLKGLPDPFPLRGNHQIHGLFADNFILCITEHLEG